jgi:hypothetical protein
VRVGPQHEIADQERELFDQTMTGDTRRHLAARIRQANELVDGMNARLERVRTAAFATLACQYREASPTIDPPCIERMPNFRR